MGPASDTPSPLSARHDRKKHPRPTGKDALTGAGKGQVQLLVLRRPGREHHPDSDNHREREQPYDRIHCLSPSDRCLLQDFLALFAGPDAVCLCHSRDEDFPVAHVAGPRLGEYQVNRPLGLCIGYDDL